MCGRENCILNYYHVTLVQNSRNICVLTLPNMSSNLTLNLTYVVGAYVVKKAMTPC